MMKCRVAFGELRYWNRFAVLFSLILTLSGCSLFAGRPSPTPGSTAGLTETVRSLPDLAIASLVIQTEDGELCYDAQHPLGVSVVIENRGMVDSSPFLVDLNGAQQVEVPAAPAGKSVSVWFSGYDTHNTALVDSGSQVEESDENNNQFSEIGVIPTLPASCQPTPIPTLISEAPLFTLKGHTAKVWSLAFSPDGRLLASGSVDDILRLWRVKERVLLRKMVGHPFPILTVAFSPDGVYLATGSDDGLARVWRVEDGRLVYTLEGHAGRILTLAFSPDSGILATGSDDSTIRLWKLSDGSLDQTVDEGMNPVLSLAFAPNGQALAWSESDGTLRILQLSNPPKWLLVLKETSLPLKSVAYSPAGDLIASGSEDGKIFIHRSTDGKLLNTLYGHTRAVSGIAFSPDGKLLASASQDSTLRIWKAGESSALVILTGHTGPVNCVAFSPDGKLLASGSDDQTVRLWSVLGNDSGE
jgi:WD40 repeat protein